MPIFRTFPVADLGGSSGWQATGSQFWDQLNEDPHDSDTTYIQAGGDSVQIRTFQFAMQKIGLPDATLVPNVLVSTTCKRLDTGTSVAFGTFRLGLYLYLSPLTYLVASQIIDDPTSYAAMTYSSATSPATGLAWTPAEVLRLSTVLEVKQAFDNVPRIGAFGRFTQLYADITFINPTWTVRDLSAQGNR